MLARRRLRGTGPEHAEPTMEMYGVPAAEVEAWVDGAGGRLLHVFPWSDISGTESTDWQRWCFVASRRLPSQP